jgi:hypothetical protein
MLSIEIISFAIVWYLTEQTGSATMLAIAGPISDAIGIQSWFVIGGIGMSLVGIIGFILPAMRNIEDQHRADDGHKDLSSKKAPISNIPSE